ncbi:helix-turn-helix domain-containing protein [Selenomonas dianae]|uniref:HTH cro/C1-type domain-containing protein n=1 Tax=Selenomonas dianae TaxID=135079 RepID=A0ABP3CQN5_9FIRM|nr:helix-turn-helix transcriptional regulator [Selenomonas dianae]WLD82586.1 helix-turn-helix transcriptional regulator [Selenomonas dianae]
MPNENTMKKTFTDNLNRLLRVRGITQAELATYMEVSNTTVNNWVKGYKVPRMDKVDKLCSFFKIKRSELLEQSPASDDLPTLTQRDSTAHSKRDLNDLAKFLNKTEVMFDGDTYNLSEEDQQKLRNALEFVFWDAKRQNKRKKD